MLDIVRFFDSSKNNFCKLWNQIPHDFPWKHRKRFNNRDWIQFLKSNCLVSVCLSVCLSVYLFSCLTICFSLSVQTPSLSDCYQFSSSKFSEAATWPQQCPSRATSTTLTTLTTVSHHQQPHQNRPMVAALEAIESILGSTANHHWDPNLRHGAESVAPNRHSRPPTERGTTGWGARFVWRLCRQFWRRCLSLCTALRFFSCVMCQIPPATLVSGWA